MTLWHSLAAFAIVTGAAWAIGDWCLHRLGVLRSSEGLVGLAMALLFGFGAAGQAMFLLSLIPGSCRAWAVWPVTVVLFLAGVRWLIVRLPELTIWSRRPSFALSAIFTVPLTIYYLGRWLGVLLGYPDGSDVFSHHYAHAKVMMQLGHFGYDVRFPAGMDHMSNYNPGLIHMMYTICRITGGDRASNLFHWLTQFLMLVMIYALGKTMRTRAAGMMAVAIYLGMSLIVGYALDPSDYVALAAFLLASLLLMVRFRDSGNRGHLAAAAVFAGFMLSTKLYGLLLLPPLALFVAMIGEDPIRRRLTRTGLFLVTAGAVYSPWPTYALFRFGDPLFPFLSHTTWADTYDATSPASLLSRFLAPGDTSLGWAWLTYISALFLPFDPTFVMWTLSPLLLIGLVLAGARLMTRSLKNDVELLAFFSLSACLLLAWFFASGSVKWPYFPAVTFAVALACMVADWRQSARALAWIVVGAVAIANLRIFTDPYMKSGEHATASEPTERWTPLTRYLNQTVPHGATVAGIDYYSKYYLREDIWTVEAQENICDNWPVEEKILYREHATFFVVDPQEQIATEHLYASAIRVWDQIGRPGSWKPMYMRGFLNRYEIRTRRRDMFLQKHGKLLTQIGATKVYRLKL